MTPFLPAAWTFVDSRRDTATPDTNSVALFESVNRILSSLSRQSALGPSASKMLRPHPPGDEAVTLRLALPPDPCAALRCRRRHEAAASASAPPRPTLPPSRTRDRSRRSRREKRAASRRQSRH